MYLNLLYNGKKYLYETNSKLNIGHLKELSEKILNSDKSLMHIIYNNNKYIFPNDKTFLKDLIPRGKRRTAFSIKVDDKDNNNNDDQINYNNNKTPKQDRKSFDEAIKSNIKRNIFKNFSNIWNIQKNFNNTLTYKYNEFLIEIREFNRRVNEIYDELFQNYTYSNMNYNHNSSENNSNDANNKLTEITQYEYQMIKFIERQKLYYQKLNILIKKCMLECNNKIIISNKNLEELYKEMSNYNEFNYKMEDDVEFNTNLNNKLFQNFDQKKTILDNNSILSKTKKHLSFEDSSLDKTIKINKKKKLPLLYDNNSKSNNEIIVSKDKKMMISTELGLDGIQRGKITLLSNEDKKKSLFSLRKNNNNNIDDNKMIEKSEEVVENRIDEGKEKEENNPKINLIKNRLTFRNKKTKDYFVNFKTKEEKIKNKSILRNLS
jgi:hypothetical protein